MTGEMKARGLLERILATSFGIMNNRQPDPTEERKNLRADIRAFLHTPPDEATVTSDASADFMRSMDRRIARIEIHLGFNPRT